MIIWGNFAEYEIKSNDVTFSSFWRYRNEEEGNWCYCLLHCIDLFLDLYVSSFVFFIVKCLPNVFCPDEYNCYFYVYCYIMTY